MGKISPGGRALAAGLAVAARPPSAAGALPADTAAGPPLRSATFSKYSTIQAGSTGDQAKAMECLLAARRFQPRRSTAASPPPMPPQLAKFRKSIGLSPLKVGGRRALERAVRPAATTPSAEDGRQGRRRHASAARAAGRRLQQVPTNGTFGKATVKVVKSAEKSPRT